MARYFKVVEIDCDSFIEAADERQINNKTE